jgi:Leucine-rich repeat (LRR) protein
LYNLADNSLAKAYAQNTTQTDCSYTFSWAATDFPVTGMIANYTITPATTTTIANYQVVTGTAFTSGTAAPKSSSSKSAGTATVQSATFATPVNLLSYQVVF